MIRSPGSLQKSDREPLLPSLFKKEQQVHFTLFQEWYTLSLTENKQFARKTKEWIPNPAIDLVF